MADYDPERLAVYRLARRHTRAVQALLSKTDTRGFAPYVDNLRRSATSIPANTKEGYGEYRPAKKIHYYQIAKASVAEAWGHTDTLVDLGLVEERDIEEIRDLQNQMMALLITMIRNLESKAD
jgi:four helix bundle protein